jgi:quercetin dioxygenase-like cupin family protein
MRIRVLGLVLAIVAGALALIGALAAGQQPPVVRDVLAQGLPGRAPGQRLELVRFTIAPGTRLAPHTHPGMQVVRVVSGRLAYTVVRGAVRIRRSGGSVERVAAGREVVVRPGDSFVEGRGLAHFGRNPGDEPLVLLVASLLDRGRPPSTPYP